jgi:hypothetical protein
MKWISAVMFVFLAIGNQILCSDSANSRCNRNAAWKAAKIMAGTTATTAVVGLKCTVNMVLVSAFMGGIVWPTAVYYYERKRLWPIFPGISPLINDYKNPPHGK